MSMLLRNMEPWLLPATVLLPPLPLGAAPAGAATASNPTDAELSGDSDAEALIERLPWNRDDVAAGCAPAGAGALDAAAEAACFARGLAPEVRVAMTARSMSAGWPLAFGSPSTDESGNQPAKSGWDSMEPYAQPLPSMWSNTMRSSTRSGSSSASVTRMFSKERRIATGAAATLDRDDVDGFLAADTCAVSFFFFSRPVDAAGAA